MQRVAVFWTTVLLAGVAPPPAAPQAASPAPAELAAILERAGRYVLEYEQAFPAVAAEEEYTQIIRRADQRPRAVTVEGAVTNETLFVPCDESECRRRTTADAAFAKLGAGVVPWGAFRDVYEVGAKPVREREARLEEAFATMPADRAEQRGRALLEVSDTLYNIGTALRGLDSPFLALVFLHPQNQSRFAWALGGRDRRGGVDAVVLAFRETARPTIVDQPGPHFLPAQGRIWVDEARGTILRSETQFAFEPGAARADVLTEFRLDPSLAFWLPVETQERHVADLEGRPPAGVAVPTKATARYSGFRRISASTGEARAGAPAYDPELAAVLRRAGEYVAQYESDFRNLVAEETYTQRLKGGFVGTASNWRPGRKRTTKAELVFVRLAGEVPWASYRDVYEVDGRKVRDRDERLTRLFTAAPPDVHEQARRLLRASAEFNIGPKRTVNLPTLPLLFLHPRNQARFAFQLGERRTIASTQAVEVLFHETSRPTFVDGPNRGNLPASGRFWVSAARGTVVRSEVAFDFGPNVEARVSTEYRPEAKLAMWVPAEMKERFTDVGYGTMRTFQVPFEGEARYAGFKQFSVTTEESATVPEP